MSSLKNSKKLKKNGTKLLTSLEDDINANID
jgi:hypothetical protein